MISFRSASATDAGRVRTVNQDVALTTRRVVAVADGMGGHAAGDVAARVAIEALDDQLESGTGRDGVVDAAKYANRAVYREATEHEELRGMGTTLTAVAIVDEDGADHLCLVNVGDSRAYLLFEDELTRLTEDHSLVEQMVRQGELTPDQAAVHPHRHILTRALGIDVDVDVDSWMLEPRDGMRFLLCSDGLTNECTEEEIRTVLLDLADPAAAANDLVERAVRHGGNDNVTAVVLDISMAGGGETASGGEAVDADPVVEDVTSLPAPPQRVRAREHEASAPRRTSAERRPPRRAERIVTGRVVLFAIVLMALLGGIAGFTVWFDRATYFVGIDHGNVAIFEGRPGGLLWFQPTLVTRTSLAVSGVLDANLSILQAGILRSSYAQAQFTVENLIAERSLLGMALPASTTTSTTTTTTVSTTTTTPPKPKKPTGA